MKSPAVGWQRVGRLFQVSVFAAASLSCGDSGTGPSTTTDETPPSVLSMDPAAGSFGASRSGAIRVTFSEPIAPATVNTTTFTVTSAGTGVPGSVSASGSVATFTPGAELATGALHEARVTNGITDVAGNARPGEA